MISNCSTREAKGDTPTVLLRRSYSLSHMMLINLQNFTWVAPESNNSSRVVYTCIEMIILLLNSDEYAKVRICRGHPSYAVRF